MKRKVLACILCALMLLTLIQSASADTGEKATRYLEINKTNFPDDDLRGWIIEHLPVSGSASGGYYMTQTQVNSLKEICINGYDDDYALYDKDLSLKGLEKFTALESLELLGMGLKSFAFSSLKKLKTVKGYDIYCKSDLDFSGSKSLVSICWESGEKDECDDRLNVSDCPELKQVMACARVVNAKNCTKLETLAVLSNAYVGIGCGTVENIGSCPNLKELYCDANKGKIDLSKNTLLETLYIWDVYPTLDLSKNTGLKTLAINGSFVGPINKETEEAYAELEEEKTLAKPKNDANMLQTLDLSKNTALVSLELNNTQLTSLQLTRNTKLESVSISDDSKLKTLDFGENVKLASVEIYNSEIKTLNFCGNPVLKTLTVVVCPIDGLDLSRNTKLEKLNVQYTKIAGLDLSACTALAELNCRSNMLSKLKLSGCTKLTYLTCSSNRLTELDLSACTKLTSLDCSRNRLTELDLSACTALTKLTCDNNRLTELDLSHNPELERIEVQNNRLLTLDLSHQTNLDYFSGEGQTFLLDHGMEASGDSYTLDLAALTGAEPDRLINDGEFYNTETTSTWAGMGIAYDSETGVLTADRPLRNLVYRYETDSYLNYESENDEAMLTVKLLFPYEGKVTVKWTGVLNTGAITNNDDEVEYKGTTPYMMYTSRKAYEPAYRVFCEDGVILERDYFDTLFQNNDVPGSATIKVTMKQTGKTASNWFKLYLPATDETDVSNTKTGITVAWRMVDSAKGYVIYRRAWNLVDAGWTTFERWNNTTATSWTDAKVFAGTRYQYGVKAYYKDPMNNYDLGMIGPLRTTTRITTRTLKSATAGTKCLTAKWDGSKTVTGYQVKVATDVGFTKNVKAVKVTKPDIYQTTVKWLQSGTTYYVTVRGYQVFEGMTYFGEWSNVLSCKVK